MAPIAFTGTLAAAAKVNGASPTGPVSIAPAPSASSSGAAAGNSFHSILYGTSFSMPAASITACELPF
jgi:hypothetical protein